MVPLLYPPWGQNQIQSFAIEENRRQDRRDTTHYDVYKICWKIYSDKHIYNEAPL